MKSFGRPSWGELKNAIRVAYVDRADGFTEKTAQAQDLASIEVQGGEVSLQDLTLRGFSNATAAQQAAARGLAALAYPLATLTVEADRSAWSFRPGMVFKLVWPPLGITGMICRVVRVGTGRLDSGKIEIEAMEDVFAVARGDACRGVETQISAISLPLVRFQNPCWQVNIVVHVSGDERERN